MLEIEHFLFYLRQMNKGNPNKQCLWHSLRGQNYSTGQGCFMGETLFCFCPKEKIYMYFRITRKNLIVIGLLSIFVLYLGCFNLALASEINKENIIYLVNQSRSESGVSLLEENEKLDQAAKDKLDDMLAKNYFAHTSPEGVTPWHWIEKNGYDYQYAGENLALGFTSSENEHKAWMESPTHKKNILNPNYKEIGVAVGRGTINDSLVTVAVQMFGSSFNGSGGKEESNISDDKSQELLEKNKEENKGIVLNTESSGPKGKYDVLIKDRSAEPRLSLSEFFHKMMNDRVFLDSSVWMTAFIILISCIVVSILVALIMILHKSLGHLRLNQDIFKVVHSILVLMLIGTIMF